MDDAEVQSDPSDSPNPSLYVCQTFSSFSLCSCKTECAHMHSQAALDVLPEVTVLCTFGVVLQNQRRGCRSFVAAEESGCSQVMVFKASVNILSQKKSHKQRAPPRQHPSPPTLPDNHFHSRPFWLLSFLLVDVLEFYHLFLGCRDLSALLVLTPTHWLLGINC